MKFYDSEKLKKIFSGEDVATYIISEVGVNHNGNFDEAIKLIDASIKAGVDAVKFQKRN